MKKLAVLLFALHLAPVYALDQVLVLSGGDNPGLNHYSQYLQTKTIYDYLFSLYGDQVKLYFGAGNNNKSQPLPLDVHKIAVNNGEKEDQMITGVMSANQAATKSNIIAYFLSPAVQALTAKDNLFLFVSDHGMPNQYLADKTANPTSNNCIDLWHYQQPFINNFGNQIDFYNACLSRGELEAILSGLNAKHIVFEMSQCYSGGFHQLSVNLNNGYPQANTKICGFTASPADHYASGCTADADGASYKGYERSFTEWFTGKNVVSGELIRDPAKSIFSAHQQAALEDMTIDVPLSTSDYFLLQWADLFNDNDFISRVPSYSAEQIKETFYHYKNYINGLNNTDLKNFIQFTQANEQRIAKLIPITVSFTSLSLSEQNNKINKLEHLIQQQASELETTWEGMMAIYLQVVMPAWEKAVNQHQISYFTDKQYRFEQELYQPIVAKRLFKHPYQFEMYFLQYLAANHNDADLVSYQKNRNAYIKKWALANNNQTLANAIITLEGLNKKQQILQKQIAAEEKNKQLLKRIFTYNKIIAAWATLLTIHDEKALADLNGLIQCQHVK